MSNLDTTVALATSAPPSSDDKKKRGRRGKGSKFKATEKFREFKNNTVGESSIRDRISRFSLEFGYSVDELFRLTSTSIPVVKPDLLVYISTSAAIMLTRLTVTTLLSACKVPSSDADRDIETVLLVTSLQIAAKVYYACVNSQFSIVSANFEALCERVAKNLDTAILPLAIMIDQIGKCEFDGQRFFPRTVPEGMDGDLPTFSFYDFDTYRDRIKYRDQLMFFRTATVDGSGVAVDETQYVPLNLQGPNGGMMFLKVINEELAASRGYIRGRVALPNVIGYDQEAVQVQELFRANGMPSIDSIFSRYSELLSRIQRKLAVEKLPQIHLASGKGSLSQLAANGPEVNSYTHVWAPRPINPTELFMSGVFQLGQYLEQPLYDSDICAVSASVDIKNALPRLVECLTKRVERK